MDSAIIDLSPTLIRDLIVVIVSPPISSIAVAAPVQVPYLYLKEDLITEEGAEENAEENAEEGAEESVEEGAQEDAEEDAEEGSEEGSEKNR